MNGAREYLYLTIYSQIYKNWASTVIMLVALLWEESEACSLKLICPIYQSFVSIFLL